MCLRHTRVCLSTLAGCKRAGVPGGTRPDIKRDASASIGTRRDSDGTHLGTHLRQPREALHLAGSCDAAPHTSRTLAASCVCACVAGGTARRTRNVVPVYRGALSSGNDTAGRHNYPSPDRLYDQLGRPKCMIAPPIHKAPLACRSDGYGCYVRFNLRNMFLFLHHNLGRQLRVRLIFDFAIRRVNCWHTVALAQYDKCLAPDWNIYSCHP